MADHWTQLLRDDERSTVHGLTPPGRRWREIANVLSWEGVEVDFYDYTVRVGDLREKGLLPPALEAVSRG